MPPLETVDLRDRAVLWPATGAYGRDGMALIGAPVEIPVRWLDKQSEALDPQGNTITLDATAVVDRVIPIGSQMWHGTLNAWYGVGSAGQDTGVCYVKVFNGTPDVKGRNERRTVGLMRKLDNVHSA